MTLYDVIVARDENGELHAQSSKMFQVFDQLTKLDKQLQVRISGENGRQQNWRQKFC